jgi:hypothetical protein
LENFTQDFTDSLFNSGNNSSLDIGVRILNSSFTIAVLFKVKEVLRADTIAFTAINFVFLVVIPVVTNIFSAFIEAVSKSVAVLFNFVFSSLKSTLDLVLFDISSLSETSTSLADVSSCVSHNTGYQSLDGNDCGENFFLSAFDVRSAWSVEIIGLTSPVVMATIAIL